MQTFSYLLTLQILDFLQPYSEQVCQHHFPNSFCLVQHILNILNFFIIVFVVVIYDQ